MSVLLIIMITSLSFAVGYAIGTIITILHCARTGRSSAIYQFGTPINDDIMPTYSASDSEKNGNTSGRFRKL